MSRDGAKKEGDTTEALKHGEGTGLEVKKQSRVDEGGLGWIPARLEDKKPPLELSLTESKSRKSECLFLSPAHTREMGPWGEGKIVKF